MSACDPVPACDPDPLKHCLPPESEFSLVDWRESSSDDRPCSDCNGTGAVVLLISRRPCKACGGTGSTLDSRRDFKSQALSRAVAPGPFPE